MSKVYSVRPTPTQERLIKELGGIDIRVVFDQGLTVVEKIKKNQTLTDVLTATAIRNIKNER